MAGNRKIAVVVGTKSDAFRAVLIRTAGGPGVAVATDGPGGIAAAAREIDRVRGPFGYAFAIGIAGRTPDPDFPGKSYATTRAARRGTKSVRAADGIVTVRIVRADGTTAGYVSVDTATGKTTRTGDTRTDRASGNSAVRAAR